jgi:four helix bundle protein
MTQHQHATRFAHQRLDAYRVAFRLFCDVEEVARSMPTGHAELKDQLRRAAQSTVRNLAEGANRVRPRDKAARFAVACGEIGETDAALGMVEALGLAPSCRIQPMRSLAGRVAAMPCGLIRREQSRS